jgi:hypothetical protein
MSVPVLLDENLEHEVLHRLRDDGHDAEHVDFHDQLRKGDDDDSIAEYSRRNDVLIVTYDDDFEEYYDESDYWGVLFFTDNDWPTEDVADTVDEILPSTLGRNYRVWTSSGASGCDFPAFSNGKRDFVQSCSRASTVSPADSAASSTPLTSNPPPRPESSR